MKNYVRILLLISILLTILMYATERFQDDPGPNYPLSAIAMDIIFGCTVYCAATFAVLLICCKMTEQIVLQSKKIFSGKRQEIA